MYKTIIQDKLIKMLDSQNSKYTNDKIIYYLLILIWLINLFSINTGFYSVKNFTIISI